MVDVKNETHVLSIIWLASCAAVLGGCHAPAANPVGPIKEMRLVYKPIDGQQHLFSTFGFWALDASLRGKLLSAYSASGALNRTRLRELLPEAEFSELPDHVRLIIAGIAFPEILLSDGWLLALDPKFDQVVIEISEIFRKDD